MSIKNNKTTMQVVNSELNILQCNVIITITIDCYWSNSLSSINYTFCQTPYRQFLLNDLGQPVHHHHHHRQQQQQHHQQAKLRSQSLQRQPLPGIPAHHPRCLRHFLWRRWRHGSRSRDSSRGFGKWREFIRREPADRFPGRLGWFVPSIIFIKDIYII